jgi:hypothetical protein
MIFREEYLVEVYGLYIWLYLRFFFDESCPIIRLKCTSYFVNHVKIYVLRRLVHQDED